LAKILRYKNGSWQELDSIPPKPGDQAATNLSLAVEPRDSNALWLGGSPVYIYKGGVTENTSLTGKLITTWTSGVGINGPHPDSRAMVFAGNDLLEADDGGVYRLPDILSASAEDSVWRSANGNLALTEIVSSAYDPINDVIVAGAQDNGSSIQTQADSSNWVEGSGGD